MRVAADIQKVDYNKKKNCFQIVTPERIYHIRCDREDDLVDWVNSIRKQQAELLYGAQKSATSASPSVAPAATTTTPSPATPTPTTSSTPPQGAGMSAPAPAQPHDVRVFVYAHCFAIFIFTTLLSPF